ncbi:MAG: hypothetical protein WBA36_14980 [Mesorhizobium sp.]
MNDRSNDRAERRSFAQIPPGFETGEDAEKRCDKLLGQLEQRPDLRGAKKLALTLRSCGKPAPCRSAACPRCNRAFRLRLYQQAQQILPRQGEILAISLIPKSSRIEVGQLQDFDFSTWVESRQRAISRALPEDAIFIGGVDISLNTWENSDAHWCFHLYGFIILPDGWGIEKRRRRQHLRAAIAQHCPSLKPVEDGPNERPLLLKQCTLADFRRGFLYAYKSQFYKRSRYMYQKRDSVTCSSNVHPQRLPITSEIDLALFLARYGVGTRLMLVGVRRQGHDATFRLIRNANRQSSGLGGEMAR